MNRQYVHLSSDYNNAVIVDQRHGKSIVLKVNARGMQKDGYLFFMSNNGIWLVEFAPKDYLIL